MTVDHHPLQHQLALAPQAVVSYAIQFSRYRRFRFFARIADDQFPSLAEVAFSVNPHLSPCVIATHSHRGLIVSRCLACGSRCCGADCQKSSSTTLHTTWRAAQEVTGQRPTLPHGRPCSTIGAGGLNGSVRNGKRCGPSAMATRKMVRIAVERQTRPPMGGWDWRSCSTRDPWFRGIQANGN